MTCKHLEFWFDRSIFMCCETCDERMHDVCTECGKTTCQIMEEDGQV